MRVVIGFLLLSPFFAAGFSPRAAAGEAKLVLKNEHLLVEVSLEGEHAWTIKSLRTGKEFRLEGEEFIVELAGGLRIRSSECRREKVAGEPPGSPQRPSGSPQRIVATFSREGLRISLVTQLNPGEWWATRWLELEREAGSGDGGTRLARIVLADWRAPDAGGQPGSGKAVETLGYPSGCGQAVYSGDFFFALAHPGAENFAKDGRISCAIPASDELSPGRKVISRKMVLGSRDAGAPRRAFLGYIDATRAVPSRMIFLVNDWYWKDKSKPLQALESLAQLKMETKIPIDTFTLDDGWDFDWDETVGIWGRLNRTRFPGGWEALKAAGGRAGIGVSLWFGPIGGYGHREKRIEFGRKMGFEVNGDKLCLAGPRYRRHVIDSFSRWAAQGMDYIKVDGFWPDCARPDHGHPVGPAGAIAQMDALMEVFAAWRRARPDLAIGYTSGSSPSPFWLQHADYVWRGGADDSHAGAGDPFDRHNTYIDTCLQAHRSTDMPASAFVTFDIVQGRIAGVRDESFERGFWWLSARGSLHHDWYFQASDLTRDQWKMLERAARWAKEHERAFRWARMTGGDPGRGEIYGFQALDAGQGTLALRNPGAEPRVLEASLAELLDLAEGERSGAFKLRGVFGDTKTLEGLQAADSRLRVALPPLAIAVWEVAAERAGAK